MLSERQEIILNNLIREYLDSAEPISSDLLKKRIDLDVSPATIRNDLQELTELGYVIQPHTSAGRIPTEQGYRYFVEITFHHQIPDFSREIEVARRKIEKELEMAKELTYHLQELLDVLRHPDLHNKEHVLEVLKIIGPLKY